MGHLVLINRWGYLTLFGLFQPYYTTSLHISLSAISWIGSVQIFLVYFVRAFSGRALDAGLHHAVLISGSVLQVLGVLMTSFATQYWQVFLAQGVCKGLGDGLVFCPTVFGCDLFLHETGAGYGGHGVGGCDGRDHLSARCATASTPDWLHVDGPDSGLYYPV